ncbi:hypothetical protein [Agromyces bauzanensis]
MNRASAAGAALAYRLPGEWWEIPLTGAEAAATSVRALVRTRLGRRDDLAAARADQRRRLTDAATRAMSAGATQLHVSQRDGGVALASMLTEYRPRLPLGGHAAPALVADALARELVVAEAPDTPAGAHWDAFAEQGGAVFARADGFVLRCSRTREVPSGGGDAPALTVDYWLTVPGHAAVVLVSFTTALAELAPLMTELFDGVVAAAEWNEDAAAHHVGPPRVLGGRA